MSNVVTRLDLSTVGSWVDEVDGAIWHKVEYNGDRYILVASDVKEDDIENMFLKDPISAIMFLSGTFPMKDTAVFRGDENWNIVGECDENCKQGVCTRRLASNSNVGDIELAYTMLVDYLNA